MNYFIIVNGAQQGPYTIEELRQRHIDASTLVWAEGMAQWTPAGQVEELKTLFDGNADNDANATATPPPMPGTNAKGQRDLSAKKTMKVWTWIGAAAVALLIIMAVANPSREEHQQAIKENMTNGIEKGLTSSTPDNEDPFKTFGTAMLKAIATPMVNAAIDNMLQYHNYLFWSTTTIELPDPDSDNGFTHKTVRTSLGIFGKVFTSDENDIAKAISKIVNDESSVSTHSAISDHNDGATPADNNDIASQVSDSVMSISSKVGKSVARKVSQEVSKEIKKEIKQNTDSTTASGLGKIVDAVENFLKSL